MIHQDVTIQPHQDDTPHPFNVGDGWRVVAPGRTGRGESTTSVPYRSQEEAAAAQPWGGHRG